MWPQQTDKDTNTLYVELKIWNTILFVSSRVSHLHSGSKRPNVPTPKYAWTKHQYDTVTTTVQNLRLVKSRVRFMGITVRQYKSKAMHTTTPITVIVILKPRRFCHIEDFSEIYSALFHPRRSLSWPITNRNFDIHFFYHCHCVEIFLQFYPVIYFILKLWLPVTIPVWCSVTIWKGSILKYSCNQNTTD